jgi:hypothetical protein
MKTGIQRVISGAKQEDYPSLSSFFMRGAKTQKKTRKVFEGSMSVDSFKKVLS